MSQANHNDWHSRWKGLGVKKGWGGEKPRHDRVIQITVYPGADQFHFKASFAAFIKSSGLTLTLISAL